MKYSLLFLIVLITIQYGHSQNDRCYTYDAAGNRIKRVACILSIKNPEGTNSIDNLILEAISKNTNFAKAELQEQILVNDLSELVIYPNPTSGFFELINQQWWEGAKLHILSVEGKMIGSKVINSELIDLTYLASGQYYLLLAKNENRNSAKLIITK